MAVQGNAFRQSRPVLITSLVNKSGAIGLSLLPMLLVEGNYSSRQSSIVMTAVKGSVVIATLAAGWLSDTIGLRVTLLGSFLLAAFGLTLLPMGLGYWALLISGIVAQFGIASVNSTARLLLTQTVDRENQKEALGWMRTVNNLGQILSFTLASMTATLGARLLIWFDALTSFFAFLIGSKILPKNPIHPVIDPSSSSQVMRPKSWWPFIGCILLLTGWNFMYEFYMSGMAGKLKLLYPVEGLRIFSILMVANTILCTAFAVMATRIFKRMVLCISIGVTLNVVGLVLAFYHVEKTPLLFLSVFVMTLGEILNGAFMQFVLIRSVPPSKRENTIYSGAILVSSLGRMAAAGLAFPLIVYSHDPFWATTITLCIGLISWVVLFLGNKKFTALTA